MEPNSPKRIPPNLSFYYGKVVRRHLLLAVVALLIIIPLDRDLLTFYLVFGVIGLLAIILLAALTSPRHNIVIALDMIVSVVLFIFFEYFAISAYQKYNTIFNLIFLLRQVLAVIFLGALYISVKTLRSETEDVLSENTDRNSDKIN